MYKLNLEQMFRLCFHISSVNYIKGNITLGYKSNESDLLYFKKVLPDFIPDHIINSFWKENITDNEN